MINSKTFGVYLAGFTCFNVTRQMMQCICYKIPRCMVLSMHEHKDQYGYLCMYVPSHSLPVFLSLVIEKTIQSATCNAVGSSYFLLYIHSCRQIQKGSSYFQERWLSLEGTEVLFNICYEPIKSCINKL